MESFSKKSLALLFLCFILGATAGFFGGWNWIEAADRKASFQDKEQVFEQAVGYIRDMYVDKEKVAPDTVYYGAIEGMLNSLDDPHSRLMKPDDYKDMQTEISQEFGGLGIYITIRQGKLTVIAPIQGTPAYKAGLLPGDTIEAIDGDPTDKIKRTEEAVDILRGPKGSEVTLTIGRRSRTFDVTVTRDKIPIQSVYSTIIDKRSQIGYIKVTNFGEETHNEVKKALDTLHEKGMKSLILDLRNNPGGALRSAYRVANHWVGDGRIVYTRGRAPGQDKNFPAVYQGTEPEYPMAVLGNQGSASGSEIVIGALKDNDRAVVLGDTTFGKGLVQSVFQLKDGSALALTTARYFTPDGHMIQDKGIGPDVEISQDFPDTDVQRQLVKLTRGDTVLSFVKDHPDPGEEKIDQFVNTLREEGFSLDERFIYHQIRRQQLALEGKMIPADPNTDPQLRKSIKYFKTNVLSPGKPKGNVAQSKNTF